MFFRERIECRRNFFAQLGAFASAFGIEPNRRRYHAIATGVIRLKIVVEFGFGSRTLSSIFVDSQVVGDAKCPSRKIRPRLVFVDVLINAHEDFLSEFVGIFAIAHDSIDDTDDAVFISPIDLLKSGFIAVFYL